MTLGIFLPKRRKQKMKELNTDFYVPLVTLKVCKEKLVPYGLDGCFDMPESIEKIARTIIGDSDKECMLVINLDTKCHPVAVECIAVGRTNMARIEMRDVIKSSLLSNSTAIILAHNHPSMGSIIPSRDDFQLTKRVMDACAFMGIHLLDHIIVNHDEFYSMKDSGKWEEMRK